MVGEFLTFTKPQISWQFSQNRPLDPFAEQCYSVINIPHSEGSYCDKSLVAKPSGCSFCSLSHFFFTKISNTQLNIPRHLRFIGLQTHETQTRIQKSYIMHTFCSLSHFFSKISNNQLNIPRQLPLTGLQTHETQTRNQKSYIMHTYANEAY